MHPITRSLTPPTIITNNKTTSYFQNLDYLFQAMEATGHKPLKMLLIGNKLLLVRQDNIKQQLFKGEQFTIPLTMEFLLIKIQLAEQPL